MIRKLLFLLFFWYKTKHLHEINLAEACNYLELCIIKGMTLCIGVELGMLRSAELADMYIYFVGREARTEALLLAFSVNVPLRISDILELTKGDIKSDEFGGLFIPFRHELFKLNGIASSAITMAIRYSEGDIIFKITRQWFHCQLVKASSELGIRRVTPEILRIAYGRAAYDAGASISQLREVFGHRKLSFTREYLGLPDDNRKNRIDLSKVEVRFSENPPAD